MRVWVPIFDGIGGNISARNYLSSAEYRFSNLRPQETKEGNRPVGSLDEFQLVYTENSFVSVR